MVCAAHRAILLRAHISEIAFSVLIRLRQPELPSVPPLIVQSAYCNFLRFRYNASHRGEDLIASIQNPHGARPHRPLLMPDRRLRYASQLLTHSLPLLVLTVSSTTDTVCTFSQDSCSRSSGVTAAAPRRTRRRATRTGSNMSTQKAAVREHIFSRRAVHVAGSLSTYLRGAGRIQDVRFDEGRIRVETGANSRTRRGNLPQPRLMCTRVLPAVRARAMRVRARLCLMLPARRGGSGQRRASQPQPSTRSDPRRSRVRPRPSILRGTR